MRYVKDFARVLVLTEEGYKGAELRVITGLSEKPKHQSTQGG
jgi:Protein of unknown function (DUF1670)